MTQNSRMPDGWQPPDSSSMSCWRPPFDVALFDLGQAPHGSRAPFAVRQNRVRPCLVVRVAATTETYHAPRHKPTHTHRHQAHESTLEQQGPRTIHPRQPIALASGEHAASARLRITREVTAQTFAQVRMYFADGGLGRGGDGHQVHALAAPGLLSAVVFEHTSERTLFSLTGCARGTVEGTWVPVLRITAYVVRPAVVVVDGERKPPSYGEGASE